MTELTQPEKLKKPEMTPEQKQAYEEQVARAKVLRAKLREEIYPLACEIEGVEYVKNFFTTFLGILRQAGLELVDTLTVESLKIQGESIKERFPKEDKNYEQYMKLWEIVKDNNVRDAGAMLFGFESHINATLQRENLKRNLASLEDFTKGFEEVEETKKPTEPVEPKELSK